MDIKRCNVLSSQIYTDDFCTQIYIYIYLYMFTTYMCIYIIYIYIYNIYIYIYIYGNWLSTVGASFNARPRRLRHFMAKPKKWQLNSYLPISWPKIITPSLDQGQWPNRPRCSTKPCNRQDLGDGFQQESRWENCDKTKRNMVISWDLAD